MNIINLLLIFFFAYIFVFFILTRIIFPTLRPWKYPIPQKIPLDMQEVIMELKRHSKKKIDFLILAHQYLTKRYHGGRILSIIRLDLVMMTDIEKIWRRHGYTPCNTLNYLLRIFLIKSGYFKEEGIIVKHTFFNFNIHQYLKIKADKNWINVDPAGKAMGVEFGDYASLFR